MKSKQPSEKPLSNWAKIVKERAERTLARQARQAQEAERIYNRNEKRRLAKIAKEARDQRREMRKERLLIEADRQAYLDERAELREYNPELLYLRDLELYRLAKGRADFLRESARQAHNLSSIDDPESMEDAQKALTVAMQAEREAESQRGIMRRRKRLWEAAKKATQTL